MWTRRSALRAIFRNVCSLGRFASVSVLLLTPAAGAAAEPVTCGHSQQPRIVVQLLFGRGKGDSGGITQADWSGFVAQELTHRFPEGSP